MAERARAILKATTPSGDVIPNATVTVREPGTSTPIAETIYVADDPDTSQYTNGSFQTGADGIIVFYLASSKRVDVLFTKTGYTSVTEPADVQKSSLLGNHALIDTTGHTASGLTTGHVIKATGATTYAFGVDPVSDKVTTAGDLLVGSAADTLARLAMGTALQQLRVNAAGTALEYAAPTVNVFASSYTGNGADNRTISLTFTPKLVLITEGGTGLFFVSNINTGTLGLKFQAATAVATPTTAAGRPTLTTNGFIVSGSGGTGEPNANGSTFHYLAIG